MIKLIIALSLLIDGVSSLREGILEGAARDAKDVGTGAKRFKRLLAIQSSVTVVG